MNARPPFGRETRPQDCWDWTTPEDVVRHALAAYYYACRSSKPPPGERFLDAQGIEWSSRETWADTLSHFFDLRLKTDAYRLGIGDYEREARMLSRCEHPGSQKGCAANPQAAGPATPPAPSLEGRSGGTCGAGGASLGPARVQAYADRNGIPPGVAP